MINDIPFTDMSALYTLNRAEQLNRPRPTVFNIMTLGGAFNAGATIIFAVNMALIDVKTKKFKPLSVLHWIPQD